MDLSLFGGKVTDMAAGNIPAGTSPSCSDMFFSGQYVATRPAMVHALNNALVEGANIISHLDYPQTTGQTETVIQYSDGSIWTNNVQTQVSTQVGSISPNTRFKAVAAFGKFFMAFRNLSLTSPFASAQLAGGEIPRYLNSLGHLWRVTSDAPGGGLAVTGINMGPSSLVTPGPYTLGPAITSITYTDLQTINVTKGGTISAYTTATVTLASSCTLTVGQLVQMYSIIWATSGGPQWANGVSISDIISSTSFKILIDNQQAYNSATSGTMAYGSNLSLVRENNIVTAYLAGTSPTSPTTIQAGWFVSMVLHNNL
jgi:hypothetical protein